MVSLLFAVQCVAQAHLISFQFNSLSRSRSGRLGVANLGDSVELASFLAGMELMIGGTVVEGISYG